MKHIKLFLEKIFAVCSVLPSAFIFILYGGYLMFSTSLGGMFVFKASLIVGFYALILGLGILLIRFFGKFKISTFFIGFYFFNFVLWGMIWITDPYYILGIVLD